MYQYVITTSRVCMNVTLTTTHSPIYLCQASIVNWNNMAWNGDQVIAAQVHPIPSFCQQVELFGSAQESSTAIHMLIFTSIARHILIAALINAWNVHRIIAARRLDIDSDKLIIIQRRWSFNVPTKSRYALQTAYTQCSLLTGRCECTAARYHVFIQTRENSRLYA